MTEINVCYNFFCLPFLYPAFLPAKECKYFTDLDCWKIDIDELSSKNNASSSISACLHSGLEESNEDYSPQKFRNRQFAKKS